MKGWFWLLLPLFAVTAAGQASPKELSSQPGSQLTSSDTTHSLDATAWHIKRMQLLKLQVDEIRTKIADFEKNMKDVRDPAMRQELELQSQLLSLMLDHIEAIKETLVQIQRPPAHTTLQTYRKQGTPGQAPNSPVPRLTGAEPAQPDNQ